MDLEQKQRDPNFDAYRTLNAGSVRRCGQCGVLFAASVETCPTDGTVLDPSVPAAFPFKDKFKFIAELGSGGMGAVYKAYNPLINKRVAIKVLHPHMSGDRMLRRFQNEARVMSAIDNPHIVRVLDFGVSDFGQPYMVMDFVDGESLSAVLKWRGTLSIDETLSIVFQVCQGMAAAHEKGVCHRDLKPSNIIYKPDNAIDPGVRVIDFGIAKLLEAEGGEAERLTTTGEVFGSPAYMSPEQARGVKSDQRSDIYSLGCVIYEMLTGCPPIVGASPVETIMKQLSEEAPPLSAGSLMKSFSPRLEAIVAKCLVKEPDKRYQSMTALADDLRSFQTASPLIDAVQPEVKVNTVAAAKSRAKLIASLSIVIVSLLIGWACIAICSYLFSSKGETKVVTKTAGAELQENLGNFKDVLGGVIDKRVKDNKNSHDRKRETIKLSRHREIDDAYLKANVESWNSIPIRYVDLSYTSIGDDSLHELTKLTHLNELNVENTKITRNGLPFLMQMHELKELNLNTNKLEPRDFKIIARLHDLKSLNISNMDVEDTGLSYLKNLTKLETLRLVRDRITDAGLSALANMPLSDLRLDSNAITDKGVLRLQGIPIETLTLAGNPGITNASVKILRNIPALKKLDLSQTSITHAGFKSLRAADIDLGN